MTDEVKQCPYCGEDILAVAKKCKHCGEWLDKDDRKIPIKIDVKKLGMILISILVAVIIVLLISNVVTSSHINADDLDSFYSYKSIVPSKPASRQLITEYAQTSEYLQQMLNQENDLQEFFRGAHSKKDKTKLLHSFLINLEQLNGKDIRIQVNTKALPKTFNLSGVELTLKYNEDNIPYYIVSNPQIDFIEFRYQEFEREKKPHYNGIYDYDFRPEINYIYIQRQYKKYLTKDYAEYINCHKQFDTVFKHTTFVSNIKSATLTDCIKLTFLYNKFLKRYPTFEGKKGIEYRTFAYDLYATTVYTYYGGLNEEDQQAFEYYIKHAPRSSKYYNCIKTNYNLLKANNYKAPEDYVQKYCLVD